MFILAFYAQQSDSDHGDYTKISFKTKGGVECTVSVRVMDVSDATSDDALDESGDAERPCETFLNTATFQV